MAVILADVGSRREICIGYMARLTYVETELRAVDEATRMVMIRQSSVLMES
jgi:hypothetical protein